VLIIQTLIAYAQYLLNPYKDWRTTNQLTFPISNSISNFQYSDYSTKNGTNYNGEYQIRIGKIFNYWNEYKIYQAQLPQIQWPQFMSCSFKMETVSFPFSVDCFYNQSNHPRANLQIRVI